MWIDNSSRNTYAIVFTAPPLLGTRADTSNVSDASPNCSRNSVSQFGTTVSMEAIALLHGKHIAYTHADNSYLLVDAG